MALLINDKAIFIHIPKTSGSWVEQCLREQNNVYIESIGSRHGDLERIGNFWRHCPYFYVRKSLSHAKNFQSLIGNCFILCFVRHPYEWAKSFYSYQTERGWPKWKGLGEEWLKYGNTKWHPNEVLYDLDKSSFNRFINDMIEKRPGYIYELYSWYIGTEIDFIGKVESIKRDLIKVLSKIGVKVNVEKIKSSPPVNVSKEYDLEEDSELVHEFHRAEYPTLLRYGYPIPRYI
jgi:hypothetical protein